jgi:hypothetical protein
VEIHFSKNAHSHSYRKMAELSSPPITLADLGLPVDPPYLCFGSEPRAMHKVFNKTSVDYDQFHISYLL